MDQKINPNDVRVTFDTGDKTLTRPIKEQELKDFISDSLAVTLVDDRLFLDRINRMTFGIISKSYEEKMHV